MERCQDRQRKLNDIVTWYFDYVMESLPLLLQVALLLFGCALSRYLWEIDVTVAWVVVGATALGVTFYAFIIIAGAASASCPYQTPGARILRHIHCHILPPILSLIRSAPRALINNSECLALFWSDRWYRWQDWKENISYLLRCIVFFLLFLAYDAWQLTKSIFSVLIALAYRARSWIRRPRSAQANKQATVLDSWCISWILQTSLEEDIRLSTLKFLATVPTLAEFTPTLLSDCFNILIDCVKVNKNSAVIVQGMEKLAEASAMCFFLTYSHLSIIDPTSGLLVYIRQRYRRIFPHDLDFGGLSFRHTLRTIHEATRSDQDPWYFITWPVRWGDYKLTNHEHIAVAHALSKLSWSESQKRKVDIVPPSCLSFALHYLSQDPLPSPSITTDCLMIVALYLRCNLPKTMVLEERYVHPWGISATLLTNTQCTT
jgi:hypothetical protein